MPSSFSPEPAATGTRFRSVAVGSGLNIAALHPPYVFVFSLPILAKWEVYSGGKVGGQGPAWGRPMYQQCSCAGPLTTDGISMLDRPARRGRLPRGKGLLALLIGFSLMTPAVARGTELRQTPIVRAEQRVQPSVVSISGEKTVAGTATQAASADSARRVNGMGTGVIIDPRGYILTNFHVVDGVQEIQVTLDDEKRYTGRLVARDLETDLAIVKINTSQQLTVIPIGTSSDLMRGEPVIAVGNAFGYKGTVTEGIISALHRAVQISDAQFYDDLIQTSASINPGNSGGPLVNIDGEMIGINVAVRAGAQGIGFAIPADKAMSVAATLLASTGVKSWHGMVSASESPASLSGMKVASVEKKSPAADCGIQPGDVVTAVGDSDIHRALDFQRILLDRRPGDKLDLSVQRGGKTLTVNLQLAEVPDSVRQPMTQTWDLLGLELKPLPTAEFKQKFQTRYRGGLVVVDVRANSPAQEQGIRPGDVLVGMHIWETVSLDNVAYILKRPDFNSLNPVKFFILRGNETLYGYLAVSLKIARQP